MKKKIVCMLLAGGQGSRLGVLTSSMAKPAVPFGGKYRIIDFPLSNCVNSDIDTVGVLTQYRPLALNAYLGTGQHWDLDRTNGGVFVLPPYMTEHDGRWYSGTANAIWQNRSFLDQYDPDYVLILREITSIRWTTQRCSNSTWPTTRRRRSRCFGFRWKRRTASAS